MTSTSRVFEFNTHELPRRAGEMKEYQIDLTLEEEIGIPLIGVPVGEVLEVDLRLESVTEGILASADIFAIARGECTRCLEPVEIELDRKIQELYRYEPSSEKGARKPRKSGNEKGRGKKEPEADIDLESDDELWMDGNSIDLERPIRDALVLTLPAHPLCSEDCLGLCPSCGLKWADLPPEHAHHEVDARWAGLEGLDFKKLDE